MLNPLRLETDLGFRCFTVTSTGGGGTPSAAGLRLGRGDGDIPFPGITSPLPPGIGAPWPKFAHRFLHPAEPVQLQPQTTDRSGLRQGSTGVSVLPEETGDRVGICQV